MEMHSLPKQKQNQCLMCRYESVTAVPCAVQRELSRTSLDEWHYIKRHDKDIQMFGSAKGTELVPQSKKIFLEILEI